MIPVLVIEPSLYRRSMLVKNLSPVNGSQKLGSADNLVGLFQIIRENDMGRDGCEIQAGFLAEM